MAARRRSRAKPKRRTRYKSAFNLNSFIFSMIQLGLVTSMVARTTPLTFLLGGYVEGFSSSGKIPYMPGSTMGTAITMKELIDGVQSKPDGAPLMVIGENIKSGIIPFVIASTGLRITQKVLSRIGTWRSVNKAIRTVPGLGDVIKV